MLIAMPLSKIYLFEFPSFLKQKLFFINIKNIFAFFSVCNGYYMKKRIFPAVLITVTAVCGQLACNGTWQDDDAPVVSLSGTVVNAPPDYIEGLLCMVYGDTLIQNNGHIDSLLTLFKFVDDSLIVVDNFGSYGSGPSEMISPVATKTPAGHLIIMDVPTGTNIYDIPPGAEHNSGRWSRVSMDSVMMMPSKFVAVSDTVIMIAAAPFGRETSIFSLIDFRNGNWQPAEYWPEDGYNGPATPKSYMYSVNSNLCKGPAGRYFYASGCRRYAFIFRLEGNMVEDVNIIIDDNALYSASSNGMMSTIPNDGHRIKTTANSSHIYVLHQRKKEDGSISDNLVNTRGGNEIDVYDWDGNLQVRYILDHQGYFPYVNSVDKDLYVMGVNPDSGAYEWIHYRLE